ncbi:MAG: PilN domain-containing protein, partial [Planctomycetota bacterium]
ELPIEPVNLLKPFGSSPFIKTISPSALGGLALAFGLGQPDFLDRINLLPTKTQRLKEKIKTTFTEKGIWRLVLPVLIPLILLSYLGLTLSINKYQRKVNDTRNFLDRLEIQWPGLEKLSQEKDDLLNRVAILETLTGQQLPWENLFREFSNLSITERLWLTNLVCSKQTNPSIYTVQVTGYGLSQSDVTDFMVKLSRSPYLNKINLISSAKTGVSNVNPPEAIRFIISTQLNLDYLKSQLKKEQ